MFYNTLYASYNDLIDLYYSKITVYLKYSLTYKVGLLCKKPVKTGLVTTFGPLCCTI
jgi:hypothetical protein